MAFMLECLSDPRSLSNFNPLLLPFCDGGALPPQDATSVTARRMIEFASLYYVMNEKLVRIDEACAANDEEAELAALNELRAASHARDALEDRYAAEGFCAEPVMVKSRYVDLQFTWAGKPPSQQIFAKRFESVMAF